MSPPYERQVEWQRAQVRAATAAGVSRVVKLSSYESAPDSRWTMGRWHWDGEAALCESGLPHAVLRPQYFQENLLLAVDQLRGGRLPTYIPPGRPVGAVRGSDISDVAAALLAAASSADRSSCRPAQSQSPPKTPPPRPGLRSAPTSSWITTTCSKPRADLKGRPEWFVRDLVNIRQFCSPEINDTVPSITGHPARTIAEVADPAVPSGGLSASAQPAITTQIQRKETQ